MNSIKSLDELAHQLNPLSAKEAAMIYGESLSNFYKRIRRGEIPGVYRDKGKSGSRIKICPREFVAWLNEQITGCRRSQSQPTEDGKLPIIADRLESESHTDVRVIQRKEGRIA